MTSPLDTEAGPRAGTNGLLGQLANVESELDFIRLSDNIEEDLLEANLREYQYGGISIIHMVQCADIFNRQYLDELNTAKTHLDGLLTSTAATLSQLSEISASFRAVDSQTQGFQKQSTGILEEQKRNEKYAQELADNLQYYEPLEKITRRLNAPGAGALVR